MIKFNKMMNCWLALAAALSATAGLATESTDATTHAKAIERWRSWKFGLFLCTGPNAGKREESNTPYNPTNINTKVWADLIAESGAKYTIFIAQWHDEFVNWDTKATRAGKPIVDIATTDYKRDLVKDYLEAVNAKGIPTILYYSQRCAYATYTPGEPYTAEEIDVLMKELMSYPHAGFWFDNLGSPPRRYIGDLKKANPEWIVGRIGQSDFRSTECTPGPLLWGGKRIAWERCEVYYNNWFDTRMGSDPGGVIPSWPAIQLLVRTAGNGGNLALAISPDREGAFTPAFAQCLKDIGAWLKANGESIYSTEGGPYYYEPGRVPKHRAHQAPWGATTCRGNKIYLHLLKIPPLPSANTPAGRADGGSSLREFRFDKFGWDGRPLTLPALPERKVTKAYLLNQPERKVSAKMDAQTLVVDIPEEWQDPLDTIVVLELDGDAVSITPINCYQAPVTAPSAP